MLCKCEDVNVLGCFEKASDVTRRRVALARRLTYRGTRFRVALIAANTECKKLLGVFSFVGRVEETLTL